MPRIKETKPEKDEGKVKRAGIYCRVSTREQGESGISLKSQERRCIDYCGAQNYQVIDTFVDAVSAKDLERPEMMRMIQAAKENKIDVIVALKLDRISRVPRDFYNLIEELELYKTGVVVVEDQWDTTTPVGRMLVGILIQFAAFEREIGIERTKAATKQRALDGKPGGGVPPLGYDRVKKEFHTNPTEAKIIRRIFREYLSGIGPKRIADALNKDGFRNKKHYNPDGTFRNGGRKFTEKHIHNFITNCLYCGRIHFKGEMLPGNHDAIVTEKDWNDAQEVVALNRDKRNLGNTKRDQFVLAGLLTCGICGDIISATAGTGKQKKKYTYYQCLSARAPEGKRNDCNFQSIPTEQLENVVAGMIKEIANTEGFLKAIEEEFIATSTAKELGGLKNDLKNTNRQISNTEMKIKNLIDVIANGSLDDTSPIEEELDSLNTLKQEKAAYRDNLVQEISQKESPTPNADTLMTIYKEFDELWDTFTKSERRKVLNLLIDGIEINYPKNSDKGEIILYLYNEPPIKSLYEITEGSHVYLCKLRRRDLNSQPSD
ncbi:MAG: recombinase family protein [FCB group bacterium]|nr:recombinase family protein [FCB group bacterium]